MVKIPSYDEWVDKLTDEELNNFEFPGVLL